MNATAAPILNPSPSGSRNHGLSPTSERHKRVMLLMTPKTYRVQAFAEAAERLGLEVVRVVDMPAELAVYWNYPLGVDFLDLEAATRAIVEFAASRPVDAIISVDDSASLLAARASAALGLPHNSPEAAEAARNKGSMRVLLAHGGVRTPEFRLCSTGDDVRDLAARVGYPCVVKPLLLSGSRGVIRADDPDQFVIAAGRLKALLDSIDPSPRPKPFLVEDFVPGLEVALEGVLDGGRLKVLALFDKPDPLDGPFFEETIYVTPSRLSGRAGGDHTMRI